MASLQQKNKDNQKAYEQRQRTPEERSRRAQDIMTKQHIEHAQRNGKEMTESEARSRVQKIAETVEVKRSLGEVK